jgi:hypothetical protein
VNTGTLASVKRECDRLRVTMETTPTGWLFYDPAGVIIDPGKAVAETPATLGAILRWLRKHNTPSTPADVLAAIRDVCDNLGGRLLLEGAGPDGMLSPSARYRVRPKHGAPWTDTLRALAEGAAEVRHICDLHRFLGDLYATEDCPEHGTGKTCTHRLREVGAMKVVA